MRVFTIVIISAAALLIGCGSDKAMQKPTHARSGFPPAEQTVGGPIDTTKRGDALDLLARESVCGIKIDMPEKIVAGNFGNWEHSPIEYWPADGLYHQRRYLASRDIELNFSSEDSSFEKPVVSSILLGERANLKTARNVGIGSSYDQVYSAYRDDINKEESNDSVLVAGSVYGGLIFMLENGKVSRIFLGAAAE